MATKGGPTVVTDGLVLSLDAANSRSYPGSGTTWNSLVGNSVGTLTNGPTFSTDKYGSIVFDGTNDHVQLSNPTIVTGGVGSIEAIAKPTTNTIGGVIGWGDNGTSNYGIVSIGNATSTYSDEVITYVNLSPGVEDLVIFGRDSIGGTNQLNDGKYHHIVVVIDGVENTIYLDGVKMPTISITTGNATSQYFLKMTTLSSLRIGNSTYNNGHIPFTGEIPLVQFYNRGLTSDEVMQNYNALKQRFK